jgi:hypothetical protein
MCLWAVAVTWPRYQRRVERALVQHCWSGRCGAGSRVRSWAKADVRLRALSRQAVDNFKIGFFVPGSVLTPTGQVSFPAQRAARSFRQNSSSCSRFIRPIRSSSALSKTASFHLIMRPPPLMRLGAFAIVAEERGFLKLLPCAQAHNSTAVLLRRQFAVIRPIV